MRIRDLALVGALVLAAACGDASSSATAPTPTAFDEPTELVPEYALSPAAQLDAAGVGGALFPEPLRLSAEQKAAIAALHDAFMQATAADVAALRAIEREARAAIRAGKPREEIRAILAKGKPAAERIAAAFATLQGEIWKVYTPAQRLWIEAHRLRLCGPDGPPKLTDAQVQQIRALQQAFVEAVKADLQIVRAAVAEARAARQAGKSEAEIRAILAKADEAQRRIREAERRLHEAMNAVLTPEQKANRCVPRLPGFPPRP